MYGGNVNRNGSAKNDLLFVPADASQIQLTLITNAQGVVQISTQQHYDQPARYIANNDYLSPRRGTYAKRNAAKNQPVCSFRNPTSTPLAGGPPSTRAGRTKRGFSTCLTVLTSGPGSLEARSLRKEPLRQQRAASIKKPKNSLLLQ